jgi:hypothetical protein
VVTVDYDADEWDANAQVRQPDGGLKRAWVGSWRPIPSDIEIVRAKEDLA